MFSQVQVDIVTSLNEIYSGVSQEVYLAFLTQVQQIADSVKVKTGDLLEQAIKATPTYLSLLNGTLRAEFGIADAAGVLSELLVAIRDSVQVNAVAEHENYSANIRFNIEFEVTQSLKDIGSYISYNRAGIATSVPWLDWLLNAGVGTVVLGYSVQFGSYNSRTGEAVMIPTASYNVNPTYAGLPSDNFVSRAFQSIEQKVSTFIGQEIVRRFS